MRVLARKHYTGQAAIDPDECRGHADRHQGYEDPDDSAPADAMRVCGVPLHRQGDLLSLVSRALFLQPFQGIQNRAQALIRPIVGRWAFAQMGNWQALFLIEQSDLGHIPYQTVHRQTVFRLNFHDGLTGFRIVAIINCQLPIADLP